VLFRSNTLFIIICLTSGLYSIIGSFALDTKNFQSALIFKVIPFFLGIGNILIALKLLNVISINL